MLLFVFAPRHSTCFSLHNFFQLSRHICVTWHYTSMKSQTFLNIYICNLCLLYATSASLLPPKIRYMYLSLDVVRLEHLYFGLLCYRSYQYTSRHVKTHRKKGKMWDPPLLEQTKIGAQRGIPFMNHTEESAL